MPAYKTIADLLHLDPDKIPRKVVSFSATVVMGGIKLELHRHLKGQFLFSARGSVKCETEDSLWIVPPQSAIWIPGGTRHSVTGTGTVEGYCLIIDQQWAPNMPKVCGTMFVNPLLRELIKRCAKFPLLYPDGDSPETRLVAVLIDELCAARMEQFFLPLPSDQRLRALAQRLISEPANRKRAGAWAKDFGIGERTMGRILIKETGMNFSRWRQQIQIIRALQWLSNGLSVQTVASELGYENAGSFITMFKKILGSPPGRYMAKRDVHDSR